MTEKHTQERFIFLDTETTGQDAKSGDRIIEIGCIEVIDGKLTGKTFHKYLNPEGKKSDPKALMVHGITDDFLLDKPTFRSISDELRAFLTGATVFIHNKDFDVGFLNAEFARIEKPSLWDFCTVECTFQLAQGFFPNQRNSLKALCQRLEVDDSERSLHGALLDASLLTEVFLKMTKDAEPFVDDEVLATQKRSPVSRIQNRLNHGVSIQPSEQSILEHENYLANLEKEIKTKPQFLLPSQSNNSTIKPKI